MRGRLPGIAGSMIVATGLLVSAGCGGSSEPTASEASPAATTAPSESSATATEASQENVATQRRPRKLAPLQLSGGTGGAGDTGGGSSTDRQLDGVLEAMQPVQVVLGQWRGITQKAVGGMKAVQEQQWVWDFQTDAQQPALAMTSDSGPYFRSGRLTFLTEPQTFEWRAVDPDGVERVFRGTFTEPPRDVPGDDPKGRLERTYKLTLTEDEPADGESRWQVVFNQQENNRFLLEFYRERPGSRWFRFDTVAAQREGTSIAASDTDYREKTCVVSQGLGTISVSHAGKTYWVCCTGCKAAFEDDPKKWIARAAAAADE